MPLFRELVIAQLLWSHSTQQGTFAKGVFVRGAGRLGFLVFNDRVHVRVELAPAHTTSRQFCPSFHPREFFAEMLHLSISHFLTWFTKLGFLTRPTGYHNKGNPNGGLLFNSAGPGSQGEHLPFPVSCAHGNKTIYFAKDVFVTRVEWRKRTLFPFHEFLVCYVSERQQLAESRTPRVSVITIDRYVPDQKPDEISDEALDSTPNSKPL